MSLTLGQSSGGGGSVRARSVLVPHEATGPLYTARTTAIRAPITWSIFSGNANLTINATTGVLSAIEGLPADTTQAVVVRATGVSGEFVTFTVALTGTSAELWPMSLMWPATGIWPT